MGEYCLTDEHRRYVILEMKDAKYIDNMTVTDAYRDIKTLFGE